HTDISYRSYKLMPNPIGQAKSTAVIYIGKKRYETLAKHARDISYVAEVNIRPSAFLQYMIDKLSNEAHNEMLKELMSKEDK
ncbi:hypothetical protein, partial [Escherichia coli]